MRVAVVRMLFLHLLLFASAPAWAGIQLYRGTMEAVTAPSKVCEGVLGNHSANLIIVEDTAQPGLGGYLESEGIAVGKFSGSDLAHLKISYPGEDGDATTLTLTRSGTTLSGVLNGTTTVNHCTFDFGRLTLNYIKDEKGASGALQRLTNLFEAQATLYHAFLLAQNDLCEEAVPFFEKSLKLADSVFAPGSPQLTHYIRGLANCYGKLGRTREFNALYDQRITTITDESLKAVLARLRVNELVQEGRTLLAREEYEAALKVLMRAYQLNPQSKDSIHAVMAVYIRSGRYGEAISFLEQAAARLEAKEDRREVNEIIALVYFKEALKDTKDGKGTEAEAALRKAVDLAPDNSQYLVALARMRHKDGHFDEAQKMLSQGLERITDEPSRQEILTMREKLRQTEMIIKKLQ